LFGPFLGSGSAAGRGWMGAGCSWQGGDKILFDAADCSRLGDVLR